MKNVHMWYIGVTEGKIEKEGKMRFSIFTFIYTIESEHKIWKTEKSATEIFIGEKEKWIDKGTDKQYVEKKWKI